MKKYDTLILENDPDYEIRNAQIEDVSLAVDDYCWLTLRLTLHGEGWGCVYGNIGLGRIYPDSYEKDAYEGKATGAEALLRVMDVVGVKDFNDLKDKYVRAAVSKKDRTVKIIGNITKNRWFDYRSFFDDKVMSENDTAD